MTISEYMQQQPSFDTTTDRLIEGVNEQVQWVMNPTALNLHLAPDARLKLLVICNEAGSLTIDARLAEGSELILATLFKADVETRCSVQSEKRSRLLLTSLQTGSSKADYKVDLCGAESESVVNALFAITANEQSRLAVRTNHLVADCHSASEVRGLAGGEAVGCFEGMVYVATDAQHTEAYQQNRNMLVSPTARIDTKPQLEIYADDVMCSHGATVGQMDQEAIYYMRQRGLSAEQARRLQLNGFAQDLVMRCGCETLCELLLGEVNNKLDEL